MTLWTFFHHPQKTQFRAIGVPGQDLPEPRVGKRFAAHLIYGVTGSGKTEVYLQAIQRCLDLGKSAILLVPEIALTSQTIERFRSRFGMKLAILHHRRSLGERTAAWESLRSGMVKVTIGARSAIFSPSKNVGLIIIDEEHDGSYKQCEEMPAYHARDVAVMRAKLENAVVIFGSATPAIESYYNAINGKYQLSTLLRGPQRAQMPQVRIVDMKKAMDKAGGFTHFSEELLNAVKDRVAKGEQTLLLLEPPRLSPHADLRRLPPYRQMPPLRPVFDLPPRRERSALPSMQLSDAALKDMPRLPNVFPNGVPRLWHRTRRTKPPCGFS